MTDFDIVIVGAGVVGLACAAALSKSGRSVLLLDRHGAIGVETSSRNSGVIHAGIYYPTGSLKAQLCVAGRQLLYERCRRNDIPHQKIGKLIVATNDEERTTLAALQARAADNGVALEWMEHDAVMRLEPALRVRCALWSPETGIIDQHQLMLDYRREALEHDAMLALNTTLVALNRVSDGWDVTTTDPAGNPTTISSAHVVNCAGLHADRVAELAGVNVDEQNWRLRWCKGDYFVLASRFRQSVHHLIYPLPSHAGLGVHLTKDLGGSLIAGPDTEYIDELTYDVDPSKAAPFAEAVSRYLPGVTPNDVTPGQSGIRPKLQGPGDPVRDFVIDDASRLGLPGLINLIGIESPGLTASPAIAERVQRLIEES